MNNEQWWAAERKAAEFWRKIKENQTRSNASNSLNHGPVAAPVARSAVSAARLLSQAEDNRPMA
jgi:hypothetical protein